MKQLLLVDDEKNFLLSLADMFAQYENEFRVHTAFNGREAIEILNNKEIHLVVTDLKMPELDGFGLLAHMSSHHKDIPTVVMTAFSSPETAEKLDALGVFHYIEKPIDFDQLVDKIKITLSKGTTGRIRGVSLASFLQLVGLDNKTCTLRVTSGTNNGLLYFQQGEIFDATTGELSGLEAALEIVSWEPVEIDIEEYCRKNKKNIDAPLGFILIEGARRKDERGENVEADQIKTADVSHDDSNQSLQQNVHGTFPQETQKTIDMLSQSIEAVGNISRVVIAKRDGSFLSHNNINKQTAVYVIRMALETEALRPGFQKQPVHYLTIQLEADKRFIIMTGEAVIIAFETDKNARPAEIAGSLSPVLKRAKIAS